MKSRQQDTNKMKRRGNERNLGIFVLLYRIESYEISSEPISCQGVCTSACLSLFFTCGHGFECCWLLLLGFALGTNCKFVEPLPRVVSDLSCCKVISVVPFSNLTMVVYSTPRGEDPSPQLTYNCGWFLLE